MSPEFWQAIKEFGIPAVYLVLTIVGFCKLWKHHVKTSQELVQDKKELETEVRELYKQLIDTTTESQKVLGEAIPLLRRRD